MLNSKAHKMLLWPLWIGALGQAILNLCLYRQILGAVPMLVYALGLTLVYVIESKAKVSEKTRENLGAAWELGAPLPILDLIIDLIEHFLK